MVNLDSLINYASFDNVCKYIQGLIENCTGYTDGKDETVIFHTPKGDIDILYDDIKSLRDKMNNSFSEINKFLDYMDDDDDDDDNE